MREKVTLVSAWWVLLALSLNKYRSGISYTLNMFCSKFHNLGTSVLHSSFVLTFRIFLKVGNEATISEFQLNFNVEIKDSFPWNSGPRNVYCKFFETLLETSGL